MGEGGIGAARISDDGDDDGLLGELGDTKWWPPGFRFHPTDEELILYYLKRKVFRRRIRLPMIGDVDVYKWEPWELPEKSVLRSGDKQWYFFSPRDRKYPNGSRSNRSTRFGYWKATGKDRTISQNKSRAVGNKKTLVYYQGRPPKGQRTDWVMYEYTLDEQVLVRCDNVQDYYALYKLFRKSGPGPKNGEEYGAPFREEEWNDHDDPDDSLMIHDPNCDSVVPIDDRKTLPIDDRKTLPIDDIEDLLLQMSSQQVAIQLHSGCSPYASEVDLQAEVGSCILGPPYISATSTEQNAAWCDQGGNPTSFQVPHHTSAAHTLPIGTPDVESYFTNCSEQGHLEPNEEFLEIKDFNDPESLVWTVDANINNKDHFPDADGFYDPCEYFDSDMYLAEALGPLDGMASGAYFDGFGDYETQNQASQLISELWMHEQPLNPAAAVESEQVAMAPLPASGVVWNDGSRTNLGGGETSGGRSDSESWLNSALATLLESMPSSPALASENALINKALERVSSFKAGRIGPRDHPDTAAALLPGGGGGGGGGVGRRGFIFVSFLVGFGAVFWVLAVGAAVKGIKYLWGRFT